MFEYQYQKSGKNGDILVMVLSGTLDASHCDYLLECLEEDILEGRKKLVLDCSGLDFISSVGLGMLVRVNSRMRKRGGDVKLAAVQGTVADLMSLVGLNRIFQIYSTVGEAVAALE